MNPSKRRRRLDDLKCSMRERVEAERAEWNAGRVRLGGTHRIFAGIGDPTLRESYLDAARELLDKNRGQLRQVALPILFLQRHGLELALKHSVRVLVGFRKAEGDRTAEEPKSLRRHHLKHLFRDFKRLLGTDAVDAESFALMESLVARYHRLDRSRKCGPGEWVRYREDAAPVLLDLGDLRRDLDELFKRLFARPRDTETPFGWITEYEELTHALGVWEYLDGEAEAA